MWTRRRTSSIMNATRAATKASAASGASVPEAIIPRPPTVAPTRARSRIQAMSPPRIPGSRRSSTVSESPTTPLLTAVARTMTPRHRLTSASPGAPSRCAAMTWSAKLPAACHT